MHIKTACSSMNTVDEAIADISSQFGTFEAEMVLFFASTKYSPDSVSKKMQDAFPMAQVFGCSVPPQSEMDFQTA